MEKNVNLPAQFHSPANALHPDHALTHALFLHLFKWQDVFVSAFVKHWAPFLYHLHLQVCYKKKQFKQNTRESVYSLTNSDCVYGWLCLVTQNEELTNLLRWYKPSGTSVHYIGWTRLQINTQSDNLSFFIKTSFHDNTIHTEDVCSTFSNLPPLLKGGRDLLKFCSLAWSITIILPGLFPVDRKGYRY